LGLSAFGSFFSFGTGCTLYLRCRFHPEARELRKPIQLSCLQHTAVILLVQFFVAILLPRNVPFGDVAEK